MTRTRYALLLLLPLGAAACGGPAADSKAADATQSPDTTIKPLERQPLTEADLTGLELANLSVELPWTTNAINRRPGPAAPRSLVLSAEVSEHEGFDRTVFDFSSDAPFPGYEIRLVPPGLAVSCGDDEQIPELEGNIFVVLRLSPARTSEQGVTYVERGTTTYGQARIHEAGVTCAADDVVTWISGLSEGSEVRLFEMRSPQRLVVDVR